MAEFQLGSISTGTLRTEDLLAAFHSTIAASGTPPALAEDGYADGGKAYSDEELLEVYTEQLESLCPPFVYFGTLEGDGADFGFWPDSNSLDEALYNQTGAPHLDNVPSYSLPMHQDYPYGEIALEDDNVIVQVSDHGNVTVMDMERNVLWSVV